MKLIPAVYTISDVPSEMVWWVILIVYRLFVSSGGGLWVYVRRAYFDSEGYRRVDRAIRLVKPHWQD